MIRGWRSSVSGFGDGLGALARFSLASVDDETVSVHRLLQKVVRDDATPFSGRARARRARSCVFRLTRPTRPTGLCPSGCSRT